MDIVLDPPAGGQAIRPTIRQDKLTNRDAPMKKLAFDSYG